MGDASLNLPPGFQFCPTDEELVLHFLYRKASLLPCHPNIIPDLDLYLSDPWQLHGKALLSGNRYYFFSETMEDRVTENGFWKLLDAEEAIFSSAAKQVGTKKYLVFYVGEAGAALETNWVMEEYHLSHSGGLSATSCKRRKNKKSDLSKRVVCRVYESKGNLQSLCYRNDDDDVDDNGSELSCLDEMFLSLAEDDLEDVSFPN